VWNQQLAHSYTVHPMNVTIWLPVDLQGWMARRPIEFDCACFIATGPDVMMGSSLPARFVRMWEVLEREKW
jgi:hypothetical protein